MSAAERIGFMQGRLSPQVDGRIQAFPAQHWREEFATAAELGLATIEWTLDQEGLEANPLMTQAGRAEIAQLVRRHGVGVRSITGDCFMQAPFWKTRGPERTERLRTLKSVVQAASQVGVESLVVPLVDNGRLENAEQEQAFVQGVCAMADELRATRVRIAIESDFEPTKLAEFMAALPHDVVGVNYDIGNSASLGFNPSEELGAYMNRVVHVHVKDRVRGGTTVPLGTGAADLPGTIALLERGGYRGRYVLQTARASDGDHAGAIRRYRAMVQGWMEAARGS